MQTRRRWRVCSHPAAFQRRYQTYHYKCNGKEYTKYLKVGDRAPYTGTVVSIDFDVQPHQLRHTFITELILSGANIKKVQYLAGHADVKVTLAIYAHLMENRPEDTQDAVLNAFGVEK
ncbi:MAG: tyrosine-type recombinase/integrase [Eubacteriales bacterium]|nr:tyrosine-type recombinase/integrase [Eubacteriales bacterium]